MIVVKEIIDQIHIVPISEEQKLSHDICVIFDKSLNF